MVAGGTNVGVAVGEGSGAAVKVGETAVAITTAVSLLPAGLGSSVHAVSNNKMIQILYFHIKPIFHYRPANF
jgi:hypothetical protein